MGPERVSSHSIRAGCATALYANGVDPADIQRWGRWKSPVYMRYVWRESAKLHALGHALARRANLADHLFPTGREIRKVAFRDPYRCGGSSKTPAGATRSPGSKNRTVSDVMISIEREMLGVMKNRRLKGRGGMGGTNGS